MQPIYIYNKPWPFKISSPTFTCIYKLAKMYYVHYYWVFTAGTYP